MVDGPAFATPEEDMWRCLVRNTVLSLLEPWTPDDLEYAVRNKVQLASLIKADPSIVEMFRSMGASVPTWASYFTIDYVYSWFLGNRSDFVDILSTPSGKEWLRSNVAALKELVWSTQKAPLTASELQYLEGLQRQAIQDGVI